VPTHPSSPRALGCLVWAGTLVLALGAAYASVNVNHHGSADTPRGVVDNLLRPVPGCHGSRWSTRTTGGATASIYVWRPDVPKTRELPVLDFLHGVPSDPEALIDGEGLATRVRDWVAGGGAPFVLAVPDGNGSNHRHTEWADAADGSDRVEDRLLREVIPAVEGSHRRDAVRSAGSPWAATARSTSRCQPPGHQGQPPALMSGAGRAPPRCGEIAGVDLSISWLAVRLTA
jgi:hypothetical protein